MAQGIEERIIPIDENVNARVTREAPIVPSTLAIRSNGSQTGTIL